MVGNVIGEASRNNIRNLENFLFMPLLPLRMMGQDTVTSSTASYSDLNEWQHTTINGVIQCEKVLLYCFR